MSGVRHLYVHLPFCAHRCGYCDFVTAVGALDRHGPYVDGLLAELELERGLLAPELETVFLGGGTPTFTRPEALARLLTALPPAGEVTVEANPETVTPALAALLREGGVNRVSLGAQSFQPALLATLERVAGPDDVRRAVHTLRDAGFDNISLDLIYGIPGQSAADLERDLAEALALEPEHLSCYELEAKPGTRFTHAHGEELERQAEAMEGYFERVVETLTGAGYRWYETANFCRPDAGAGSARTAQPGLLARARLPRRSASGAVSTVRGRRWRTTPSVGRYLAALADSAGRTARSRSSTARRGRRSASCSGSASTSRCALEGLGRCRRRGRARARRAPRARRRREARRDGRADPARAAARRRGHRRAPRLMRGRDSPCTAIQSATVNDLSTERQQEVLRRVVEEYVRTGQPVGSKHLVESRRPHFSPSTVRAELAELEARGLLTHPHTSAGRVPTDRGYRVFVDGLLERLGRPLTFPLDLSVNAGEVDATLQATTEALSELTRLLALVSAPPLHAATVRHVEVLLLQPHVAMVVVITSTGGVSKRVLTFDAARRSRACRSGRASTSPSRWSASTSARGRCGSASRIPGSRRARSARSCSCCWPAFTGLDADDRRLFVGGAADLLNELRPADFEGYRSLIDVLERRAALLEVLAGALDPSGRSSASGPSWRIRASATSRSSARRTASSTARSAPSACSARCAWTTRPRSSPSAPPRPSSRASPRSYYADN